VPPSRNAHTHTPLSSATGEPDRLLNRHDNGARGEHYYTLSPPPRDNAHKSILYNNGDDKCPAAIVSGRTGRAFGETSTVSAAGRHCRSAPQIAAATRRKVRSAAAAAAFSVAKSLFPSTRVFSPSSLLPLTSINQPETLLHTVDVSRCRKSSSSSSSSSSVHRTHYYYNALSTRPFRNGPHDDARCVTL